MAPKRSVNELFGDDSDDEAPAQPQQRAGTAAAEPLPPDVQEVASKLAAFVAANGRKYEALTKEKNARDSPLGFLWDPTSAAYRYYARQLEQEEARLRQAGGPPASSQPSSSSAAGPGPSSTAAVPQPKRSRWSDGPAAPLGQRAPPPSSVPVLGRAPLAGIPPAGRIGGGPSGSGSGSGGPPSISGIPTGGGRGGGRYGSVGGRGSGGRGGPAVGGGAGGNTLDAVDAYMRRLAEREAKEAAREVDSDEERRRRAAPLLKETSFDRRKVDAVYTQDGRRGHHLQDYLPPEELAKFLAPPGDKAAQAAAVASATSGGLGADNIGRKLLSKMGWKEGQAIGGQGGAGAGAAAQPVAAAAAAAAAAAGGGGSGLGLGAVPHGAVEEEDDEFTRYRKRMQTAYKYRPNPLGNPRKPYY